MEYTSMFLIGMLFGAVQDRYSGWRMALVEHAIGLVTVMFLIFAMASVSRIIMAVVVWWLGAMLSLLISLDRELRAVGNDDV